MRIMITREVRTALALLLPLWLVMQASQVRAQAERAADASTAPADGGVRESSGAAAVVPEPTRDEQLATRAEQIQALLVGKLGPDVDLDVLLTINLGDTDFGADDLLLASEPTSLEPHAKSEEAPGRRALQRALGRLLKLPDRRRAMLFARHERRHAQYLALQDEVEAHRVRRDALRRRAQLLDQVFAKSLPLEVDPRPLFKMRVGGDPQGAAPRKKVPPALKAVQAEVAEAQGRIDALLDRFLALPAPERQALFDAQEERRKQVKVSAKRSEDAALEEQRRAQVEAEALTAAQRQAEAAERAQQLALEVAKKARSEAQRLLATEKARLLGIEADLAELRGALTRLDAESHKLHDAALGFNRRVLELGRRSVLDPGKERDANALYWELRGTLVEHRQNLRQLLDDGVTGSSEVPSLGSQPDPKLFGELDRSGLDTLRARVEAAREEVAGREAQLLWDRTSKARDSIVLLNGARLALLEHTAPTLRAEVTGFGAQGVEQVRAELEQMLLTLRYHLQALPREARTLRKHLARSSITFVFALLQLILLVAVFRWWRGRADSWAESLYRRFADARPRTSFTRTGATVAWYARRVRKPVEWLLLLGAVFEVLGSRGVLPEIEFLRIIVIWVLLGACAVLTVDAMAARQSMGVRKVQEAPALRIKSLRLIALLVVGSGLVRSLTERSVGRGAIYSWTVTSSLVFILPVLWLLVWWWRPHIFERVRARRDSNPLLRWVRSNESGWHASAAALVGGVYLLGDGLIRWCSRELGTFEATQRLSAYLFRSQVEKQVQSQRLTRSCAPLPDSACSSLLAGARVVELDETIAAESLERLVQTAQQPGTLSVVVGERGLGKSTMLRRMVAALGEEQTRTAMCPSDGLQGLLRVLARNPDDSSIDSVRRDLCQGPPRIVLIDQADRLVRPQVGGLEDLDRLLELARACGPAVSWVLSCSISSWQLAIRARATGVAFDRVEQLQPWTQAQISHLIQNRCAQDGIDPDFEDLVVPRAFDSGPDEEDRVEAGYYRILWDYSDGNPSVALYFWKRSLFRDDDGKVVVRLFDGPTITDLDKLPTQLPFILRAVVQLDAADARTVAACTNLPLADVQDGIQLAARRGYLEPFGDHMRVTQEWFRAITRLLKRQHLLPES